ncbi:MAG TPA: Arc family DNA-binding protein [Kiloniellaceae bacterium]
MSTDFRPLSLRLPVHLHARVRETALANGRSLNSEIIALLEQAMSEPDRQEQMVKDMERDLKPVFEDMISDVVALANSKLANIERRQQEALDEALSSIEELRMRIEELENQGMLRIEKLEAQVEAQAASRWTVEQKIGDELEKLRDDLEAAQAKPERAKRA